MDVHDVLIIQFAFGTIRKTVASKFSDSSTALRAKEAASETSSSPKGQPVGADSGCSEQSRDCLVETLTTQRGDRSCFKLRKRSRYPSSATDAA